MKINCFYPSYSEKHTEILEAFAQGCGANMVPLESYEPCDIAVIFGIHKEAYPPTMAKKPIIDKHNKPKKLIVIESAFTHRGEYYQVAWNGFAGTGDHCAKKSPPDRFNKLCIARQPMTYRKDGKVILCAQLPRDTQVQNFNYIHWVQKTFSALQRKGHDVLFRPHPRDKEIEQFKIHHSFHDTNKRIAKTLLTAKAVVTYNSTSAVDSLICGIPPVASHPSSIAYPVSHNDISQIGKTLNEKKIEQWFYDLAYSQWTLDEMREGLTWRHLTK